MQPALTMAGVTMLSLSSKILRPLSFYSSAVMAHRGWTDESCARYTVDQTVGARWMDETHVIADKVFQQCLTN